MQSSTITKIMVTLLNTSLLKLNIFLSVKFKLEVLMSRSLKVSLALSAAVAASAMLSACEKQDAQQSKTQPAPAAEVAPQQSKSVVVYFSQTGATKKLAQIFKEARHADEVELQLVKPFPSTYDSIRLCSELSLRRFTHSLTQTI